MAKNESSFHSKRRQSNTELPKPNIVFQQDVAPCHTSNNTQKCCRNICRSVQRIWGRHPHGPFEIHFFSSENTTLRYSVFQSMFLRANLSLFCLCGVLSYDFPCSFFHLMSDDSLKIRVICLGVTGTFFKETAYHFLRWTHFQLDWELEWLSSLNSLIIDCYSSASSVVESWNYNNYLCPLNQINWSDQF